MLCQLSVVAFGICLACWVGMSVKWASQFDAYCDRVALLEGRESERNSSWRFEDGSNLFELDQGWTFIRRPYLKSSDEKLRTLGDLAWWTGIWVSLWALATLLLGLIVHFDLCDV